MKIVGIEKTHVDDLALALISAYKNEPWNEIWTVEQARNCILHVVEDSKGLGYAVIEDEIAVGAVFGRIQLYREYEFYVNHIYIHANYQKRGYAKLLLESLKKELKKMNIMQIELSTLEYDQGFYERCGFEVCASVPMEYIIV